MIDYFSERELAALYQNTQLSAANQAGGKDNVSVGLMHVEAADVPRRRCDQFHMDEGELTWHEAALQGIGDASFDDS